MCIAWSVYASNRPHASIMKTFFRRTIDQRGMAEGQAYAALDLPPLLSLDSSGFAPHDELSDVSLDDSPSTPSPTPLPPKAKQDNGDLKRMVARIVKMNRDAQTPHPLPSAPLKGTRSIPVPQHESASPWLRPGGSDAPRIVPLQVPLPSSDNFRLDAEVSDNKPKTPRVPQAAIPWGLPLFGRVGLQEAAQLGVAGLALAAVSVLTYRGCYRVTTAKLAKGKIQHAWALPQEYCLLSSLCLSSLAGFACCFFATSLFLTWGTGALGLGSAA